MQVWEVQCIFLLPLVPLADKLSFFIIVIIIIIITTISITAQAFKVCSGENSSPVSVFVIICEAVAVVPPMITGSIKFPGLLGEK